VVEQVIRVDVIGTNDAPTISAAGTNAAGSVTEDDSTPTLSTSGTMAFNDVDLVDTHTTRVAPDAGNTLGGTLVMGQVSESATTAPGTVEWRYSVVNNAVQYLDAGETATERFTVTVDDGQGGTVEQVVSITITGTNDAPTITTPIADFGFAETGNASAQSLSSSGTLGFADIDTNGVIDVASAVKTGAKWSGGTINADLKSALQAGFSISGTDKAAPGSVDWLYNVNNAALDFLAEDETITLTYTVTATDNQGATATDDVTIRITGTNDAPTITAAGTNAAGAVTEDDSTPTLSTSGTIAFSDVDLVDTHTTRVAPDAGNMLGGTLVMGRVSESATTAPGTVGWTYLVDNSNLQKLAAGENATERFTVTVDDGQGGVVEQVIRVDVIGTNDAPTITTVTTDAAGEVTEDTAVVRDSLRDSGTIVFNDVDLGDTHAIRVAPDAGNTLGGTLIMGQVSESASTAPGTVGWTYSVSNSDVQYLTAGEAATERFTVTVDDGQGGTVEQVISVVVTGTDEAISMARMLLESPDAIYLNVNTNAGTIADTDAEATDVNATELPAYQQDLTAMDGSEGNELHTLLQSLQAADELPFALDAASPYVLVNAVDDPATSTHLNYVSGISGETQLPLAEFDHQVPFYDTALDVLSHNYVNAPFSSTTPVIPG
jgi:VCBS repeat-containing protein